MREVHQHPCSAHGPPRRPSSAGVRGAPDCLTLEYGTPLPVASFLRRAEERLEEDRVFSFLPASLFFFARSDGGRVRPGAHHRLLRETRASEGSYPSQAAKVRGNGGVRVFLRRKISCATWGKVLGGHVLVAGVACSGVRVYAAQVFVIGPSGN